MVDSAARASSLPAWGATPESGDTVAPVAAARSTTQARLVWTDAMPPRLSPIARSSFYRAFTRLPHERVNDQRTRPGGRVVLSALQRLMGNGPVKVGGELLSGWLLDTSTLALTHAQAHGLVRGDMEPGVQEALRRHVAPGATVYDIGANLGFFSLLAARLGAGAVEAFEPLSTAAAGLRRNVALNEARTISVHEVAVGAHSGRAQLMAVQEGSWSHLAERGRHPDTQEVLEVDIVAIDDLVKDGLRPPDVVKIDVEGAELSVLEGMRETISTHSPAIVCELHETNAEFVDTMDAFGYEACNLDGPEKITDAGPVHALATRARATRPA